MNSGLAVFVLLALFAFSAFEAYSFAGCDDSMSEYVVTTYPPKCASWTSQSFMKFASCRDNSGLSTKDALPDCYGEVIKDGKLNSNSAVSEYYSYVCPNNNIPITKDVSQRFYCCVMFHSLELSNPLMTQKQMNEADKTCYK